MARHQFAFAPLLKIKTQLERAAEQRLMMRRCHLDQAQKRVADLERQLIEVQTSLRGVAPDAPRLEHFLALRYCADQLGRQLDEAKRQWQQAQQEFLKAREERTQIAKEVEGLNILQSAWREERQKEREKAMFEQIDERVLQRWGQERNPS